ncbi:hypothetical protein ACFYU8_18330 [Brevibacillus sp. NPDC003359]|uniref:hypothetical protein n=1 Tax=unclassified Brevibacillus TaxID=2684853 RepID=UPI00369DF3A3
MNQVSTFRARARFRKFIRKWRKSGLPFHTGLGRPNFITEIDRKKIYFKTEASVNAIVIPVKKIKEAMAFIYYKRTATRRELERYSEYSSLLMGLLQGIFPVWQVNDSWETLEGLVRADKYDFIAIGGTVNLFNSQKKRRLFDKIFAAFPNGRFHILGLSSELLYRYKWFSADSTSYLNPRKNDSDGRKTIITPRGFEIAPRDWSTEQCRAYSIQALVSLEEAYNGTQIESILDPIMSSKEETLRMKPKRGEAYNAQISMFDFIPDEAI